MYVVINEDALQFNPLVFQISVTFGLYEARNLGHKGIHIHLS